jgi:hypothetical protein
LIVTEIANALAHREPIPGRGAVAMLTLPEDFELSGL